MKYVVIFLVILGGCTSTGVEIESREYPVEEINSGSQLSPDEWKERLTEFEYHILWEKGTERAFTGDLLDNKKKGTYVTAGCGIPVFHSDQKYDSGTGWPSYWAPLDEDNIILKPDNKFGLKRTEVLSKCGEHLGHLFDDGPEPTGKRYCINSAALDFIEDPTPQ